VARAPVAGSGCAPAWMARVLKPGSRSTIDELLHELLQGQDALGAAGEGVKRQANLEHDPFLSKQIVLYIFAFAHDLIRKPLTLFGIMR
jgi:hypothetical protein